MELKRYRNSTKHLIKAEQVIPLGSQTFSKSRAQYPVGTAPLYAEKAKGAFLWDIDGNKYIDLVSNLASITLGYSDPHQNKAVKKQLLKSTGMSLPSKLEAEVAEKIIELVPSAEMVRFAKNGTDATSAAVRLSRAFTGREHVIVCGYHGWQDWHIGSTSRSKGVPASTQELTHSFAYNQIEELKQLFLTHHNRIACVVLEPMNRVYPTPEFLQSVLALCESNGAICVFDETITGFRFSKGGAQELFEVKPHLSTFGKGIANGYPLSVICGRSDIMKEMEEVFFSGTFGGELLSLAAANYVLDKHLMDAVCPNLIKIGIELLNRQNQVIDEVGLNQILSFSGNPTWGFYEWQDGFNYESSEIKSLFLQEMYLEGVLVLGTNNISLSHTSKVRRVLIEKFERVLTKLKEILEGQTLNQNLLNPPLKPVLKIR